jgi:hypothetical protein
MEDEECNEELEMPCVTPHIEEGYRPDITFYTCNDGGNQVDREDLAQTEHPLHPNVTFDINHYTTALCIEQQDLLAESSQAPSELEDPHDESSVPLEDQYPDNEDELDQ